MRRYRRFLAGPALARYTVHSFVRRIYAKLEVNSKSEAIYEARHQGLL